MSDALQKITLNLLADDVEDMKRLYGQGWSTKIRLLVHEYLVNAKKGRYEQTPNKIWRS